MHTVNYNNCQYKGYKRENFEQNTFQTEMERPSDPSL